MFDLITPLRSILLLKEIDTTNTVWRLHSRATVYGLLLATALLSATQYFGQPIDCIVDNGKVSVNTMNNLCWILGTYISKDPLFVRSGKTVHNLRIANIPEDQRLYQKYYQWVVLILAAQACTFALPNLLWKVWEGGRLKALCEDLTSPMVPDTWNLKRKRKLINYITGDYRGLHRVYAFRFFFCELLNCFIVLLNVCLMNIIFSGFWKNYQPAMAALLSFDFNGFVAHNSIVFPKLAKCDFPFVGPSGTVENRDGLCLLPLNVVNEKVFAVLWLWFIVLLIISIANVLFRLLLLCSEKLRYKMLLANLEPIGYARVKLVVRESGIGNWFLLYQLSKNMNPTVIREIVRDTAVIIAPRKHENHCEPEVDYANEEIEEEV